MAVPPTERVGAGEFDEPWRPGPVALADTQLFSAITSGVSSGSARLDSIALPSGPTLLCDAEGRVLRVNAALLRMVGRDPRQRGAADGIVDRGLSQLLVGPDSDARLARPDGAWIPVKVVRWALPPGVGESGDASGAAAHASGLRAIMLVDASELPSSSTSQRFGRAAQRYSDLVSIAPVGVGVFDHEGRLVDANPALCALLGISLERLRGVSAADLTADPDASGSPGSPPSELSWLRSVPPGARHGYRVPQRAIRRADGTSVWCELAITVSIGDDGRPFWLVVFTDMTERRRAADVLRIAGTHDELTRLPNRCSVAARIGQLLAGPDRHKLAVLCCDLADFKRVNTALGHAAGDQVLITLAARLLRELPAGCSPARLAGDEFVVVCADVDAVGGLPRLAETVSALLRAPVRVGEQQVRVSSVIGAATTRDLPSDVLGSGGGAGGSPRAAEDLLRLAQAAMYEAKSGPAGELGVVTADTASGADRQLRLEDELRQAIAANQLVLHYQPVVGSDGAVRSAEALIRWPHPDRGMLFPGAFIPVAERGNLMRELDRWVLRTAAKEAAGWPAHCRRPVGVAVNLAGLLPGDRDFLPTVRSALADSGLPRDRLVLELVETSLVSLPEETLAAMSDLARYGVRFAVDDFGTGYSSLSRIKELPAQIVKVDRTFVREISTDPADFAVARAVVQMAAAMGRYCVAEGVETAEQFHALRALGVDAYQGWLFAKALEPTALRAVLAGPPYPVPAGQPGPVPDALATQAVRADPDVRA
ncbi:MAG: EAL domain-containing protein [Pseudonocardia sp.]|nr:EAL domain-containing protein [Pseudonocardia sp.]